MNKVNFLMCIYVLKDLYEYCVNLLRYNIKFSDISKDHITSKTLLKKVNNPRLYGKRRKKESSREGEDPMCVVLFSLEEECLFIWRELRPTVAQGLQSWKKSQDTRNKSLRKKDQNLQLKIFNRSALFGLATVATLHREKLTRQPYIIAPFTIILALLEPSDLFLLIWTLFMKSPIT